MSAGPLQQAQGPPELTGSGLMPPLQVHFCCDGNVLATADIPLSHLSRMQEFSGEYPLSSPNLQGGGASVSVTLTLVKEPVMPAAGNVPVGQVEMGEVPSIQSSHQVHEEALVAMETVHGVGLEGEGPKDGTDTVGAPPVAMGDAGEAQTTNNHLSRWV